MSRTIIIGGGAIGLSVAYHLGQRGAGDVVLLERNQLTSGTSWHAAGIVGPLRATPNMTRLASYALELFPRLEAETGMSTGYRRTGGYWLARAPERLDELNRIADLGATQGLRPRMIAPEEIGLSYLDTTGLAGALQVPEDANVNPVDLCMAYARAARRAGVDIREGTGVQRIACEGGQVRGVTADFPSVSTVEIADGRFLNAVEETNSARVVVLGHDLAGDLFGSENPIGQEVRIAGDLFTVVGVLEASGGSAFFSDDTTAYVPLGVAQTRLFDAPRYRGELTVSSISIKVAEGYALEQAEQDVEVALRLLHGLGLDDDNDFSIFNQASLLDLAGSVSTTLSARSAASVPSA